MHKKALDFFQAWLNFAKPYDSLKLKAEFGNKKIIPKNSANDGKNNLLHTEFERIVNI